MIFKKYDMGLFSHVELHTFLNSGLVLSKKCFLYLHSTTVSADSQPKQHFCRDSYLLVWLPVPYVFPPPAFLVPFAPFVLFAAL